MRVCIYEDRAERLEPIALTRPVFELLCGLTSIEVKLLRWLRPAEWGYLVRPHLEGLARLRRPQAPVNNADWLRAGDILLVNGRWLPGDEQLKPQIAPCLGICEGEVAYVHLSQTDVVRLAHLDISGHLEHWQRSLPARAIGGSMIRYPWDLVEHNAEAIRRDFDQMLRGAARHPLPEGFAVVGPPEGASIDETARLDPYVVADTTGGPVVIDRHAVVTAFSRLEGPCYIGPYAQVHGAKVRAGTTLGPQCRVGGEVEASIMHGFSNKYHEGFLGHSYVGEWVNLGAGTHNSDLRNDYGEVSVTVNGRPVATGLSKVGCFLGDHVKTGLGTLLNTGTSVGPFCGLLPAGRFAPKYVPSFMNWWNGALRDGLSIENLFETAQTVMKRRGCEWTDAHRTIFTHVFETTAAERRRLAARDGEQRQLRRSA